VYIRGDSDEPRVLLVRHQYLRLLQYTLNKHDIFLLRVTGIEITRMLRLLVHDTCTFFYGSKRRQCSAFSNSHAFTIGGENVLEFAHHEVLHA
jgi:hypothetical protein